MSEIPGREPLSTRLFGKAAVYDFVLAPLAVLGSFLQWYDYLWKAQPVRAWIVFFAGWAVLIGGVSKAIVSYKKHSNERDTHELEGCLHALHAYITTCISTETYRKPQVRITVYRPVDDGQKLEQVTDYIGVASTAASRKTNIGRRFPSQCGIIGQAFRQKRTLVADRVNESFEDYVDELVSQWGYTRPDAKNANPGVFAWMAIPLIEQEGFEQVVKGIVFADCTAKGYFEGRDTGAVSICNGIAQFVSSRYT